MSMFIYVCIEKSQSINIKKKKTYGWCMFFHFLKKLYFHILLHSKNKYKTILLNQTLQCKNMAVSYPSTSSNHKLTIYLNIFTDYFFFHSFLSPYFVFIYYRRGKNLNILVLLTSTFPSI